jgi:phosphoglycolate phosphatase-like HAD superfamily hydrolase
MTRPDLFIDFDGVLCDSLLECLASSWYAYFFLHKKEQPAAMTLETKRRFTALRPYIRSGGDYLLIQELAEKNIGMSSQDSFDAYLDGSANKADLYARLFSAARDYLLETYPGSWVNLNPLYAHVKPRLGSWSRSEHFFILSTKEPTYIARILKANRIRMPVRRILKSPARGKLDMIRRHLRSDTARRALLVDDQLDHLSGNTEPRIKAYLASWGYVRPEWLKAGVEILDPGRFTRLLDANLGNPKRPG